MKEDEMLNANLELKRELEKKELEILDLQNSISHLVIDKLIIVLFFIGLFLYILIKQQ